MNGEVDLYYQATAAWNHNNLTTAAGSPPLAASDPIGYRWDVDKTEHIVYRGTDNHIHELWFNGKRNHNDLTVVTANPPLAAGKPAGYTWSIDVPNMSSIVEWTIMSMNFGLTENGTTMISRRPQGILKLQPAIRKDIRGLST